MISPPPHMNIPHVEFDDVLSQYRWAVQNDIFLRPSMLKEPIIVIDNRRIFRSYQKHFQNMNLLDISIFLKILIASGGDAILLTTDTRSESLVKASP